MNEQNSNPDTIFIDRQPVRPDELLDDYQRPKTQAEAASKTRKKAVRLYAREEKLKLYQTELIKLG